MVRDADYVIVLDEGRIAEEGSPAQLLKTDGWFAHFAAAAAEEEEELTEEAGEEEEPAEDDEDDIP